MLSSVLKYNGLQVLKLDHKGVPFQLRLEQKTYFGKIEVVHCLHPLIARLCHS